MPGFVQVDSHTFYMVYWPKIKRSVEAMESNWPFEKNGVRSKVVLPIVVKWGYKDKDTNEKIILAISRFGNTEDSGDEYWVHESLIEKV